MNNIKEQVEEKIYAEIVYVRREKVKNILKLLQAQTICDTINKN